MVYWPWDKEWKYTGIDFEKGGAWLGEAMDNLGSVMGLSRADKNKIENVLSGIPVVGDVLKTKNQWDYMSDYMENKGLNWEDVQYPALLNSGLNTVNLYNSVRRGTNFVSDNIKKLYR